ncbi:uncharacterized protein LOC110848473 [Folsomia candida]|uniref:uncharacterized protein LOC110848473 n=1 Tax=Folsomia candida TaxID=158441 RepID=UPI000B9027E9|nr:uncharacterized protein LOC110848473 [Folsomia candida]
MTKSTALAKCFILLAICVTSTVSIRCYQCSSDEDKSKGEDHCGVYSKFDKDYHVPVDCQGDESYTPGTFCVKLTQQSPRGFIWDGRWRQVIRRCASVADTGVTGVCNWGVYENGVYWEECYCSTDACNSSDKISLNISTILVYLFVTILAGFRA